MPVLGNNPVFTAVDVVTQLQAYMDADAWIRANILKADNSYNPTVRDDPSPGEISVIEKTRLVLTVSSEGLDDATMGGESGGTADFMTGVTAMVYYREGDNRSPAGKDAIMRITGIVRMALMRYRQGTGTPAGAAGPTQLWWTLRFRPNSKGDVTTYFTPKGARVSITQIDLVSRIPFT